MTDNNTPEVKVNCHARWLRELADGLRKVHSITAANTCEQAAREIDALQSHRDTLHANHERQQSETASSQATPFKWAEVRDPMGEGVYANKCYRCEKTFYALGKYHVACDKCRAASHIAILEARVASPPNEFFVEWLCSCGHKTRAEHDAANKPTSPPSNVQALQAEVSTLREHLAEVNRLLSLNVAQVPTPEIRAIFNKAIGVQVKNKFSYGFDTDEAAAKAFEFIAALGELETGKTLPEPEKTLPAECSGDPNSCPENEGRGCYCSLKPRDPRAVCGLCGGTGKVFVNHDEPMRDCTCIGPETGGSQS